MGAIEPLQRRKLSVDEFHRIGDAGILGEDDRIELIEGEMIEMAPIGTRHLAKVNRLSRMLALAAGEHAIVSTQNPILLPPRSEPQPDIALLKPSTDDYETRLPTAKDILLLVEIADVTIAYDRDVKIPLYAQHAVPEVWLFDIQARASTIYRRPSARGYRQIVTASRNASISPQALPSVSVDLAEVWR